jgi:hypothetical protein
MIIDDIVKVMTHQNVRVRGSNFDTLLRAVPARPLSTVERKSLSSRLAIAYAPPFYTSAGAAKAAASMHAKAIWGLSNGLGNQKVANVRHYLESLREEGW